MRRFLWKVPVVTAACTFLGCSGATPPSAPVSSPSSSAPAESKADGAPPRSGEIATYDTAPSAHRGAPPRGGETLGKGARTAADCPTVGEAVAPPGPPSVGKARHEEIVAIFQKHREKFRCCYDVARQQNPSLKGNYLVEIVLKTDGSIKQVFPKKEASDIHDQGMDDCVFTVAKALQFSPNAEGKETTIPYPFNFTPGGGK